MELQDTGKKIYFASDVHLGAPSIKNHREHENLFVSWLNHIKPTTAELYLMGDIFDFWFEYKHVVPRGFTRVLGKIAEFTDSGIPVHYFTGNHDLWVFDYLPQETGVILHREPVIKNFNGKQFYLAHGDGLGPYDKSYNRLKKIFTNKTLQWLFARLHPNLAFGIAKGWSKQSRLKNESSEGSRFLGADNEWLMLYANDVLQKENIDFFIFGHRHIDLHTAINDKTQFIYLGDWVKKFTYGVWDGKEFKLEYFNKDQ